MKPKFLALREINEALRLIALVALVLFVLMFIYAAFAEAADLQLKGPRLKDYPTVACGPYFGVNTMGATSAIENAAVGTQVVQGAIGLTIGYTCPLGAGFWFVDGMFDFANINGSANGLNLTGPAMLEQRFGFGIPAAMIFQLIPALQQLQNAVPGIIPLPVGVTVNTSSPYLYGAVHEDDTGVAIGLAANKQWLVSAAIGMGQKIRLSNGIVFDPFAEYVLPSTKLCLGVVSADCLQRGAGARVGMALEF